MTISTLVAVREVQPPGGCAKALSIAEVIERHCENCGRPTSPEDMREVMIPRGALPISNPDSPAPP
ncbi:hypothetical protein [Rhizobium laguerreae]|uniref:hypothetical protein n=1 Tax=Rhizobium laguerreae TaxID=1076926 RepID=UPI001C90DB3D|nr:hypothetical protein [Rhizobium laguerreae]MBY3130786.1 hypothetical protein [Rhizobium laguerreae]MBY3153214.1 hypothetical protein [Rhizobium laguerreae]MBY3447867.1 hypothetical protein [Rhizobium laguerreae]